MAWFSKTKTSYLPDEIRKARRREEDIDDAFKKPLEKNQGGGFLSGLLAMQGKARNFSERADLSVLTGGYKKKKGGLL